MPMFNTKVGSIIVLLGDDTRCAAVDHLIERHGTLTRAAAMRDALQVDARGLAGPIVVFSADQGAGENRAHATIIADIRGGRWRLIKSRFQALGAEGDVGPDSPQTREFMEKVRRYRSATTAEQTLWTAECAWYELVAAGVCPPVPSRINYENDALVLRWDTDTTRVQISAHEATLRCGFGAIRYGHPHGTWYYGDDDLTQVIEQLRTMFPSQTFGGTDER